MKKAAPFAWLILIGTSWGLTVPLIKISVSEGYQPFGLIFWQMVIITLVLGMVNFARGRRLLINRKVLFFYLVLG